MSSQVPRIRRINSDEIDQLIDLCEEHAAYEKSDYVKSDQLNGLTSLLFSEESQLICLVVEVDSLLVGYTTLTKQISTWDACYYLYMDCLYLKETYRGLGIGQLLLNEIKHIARQEDCSLIQWQTPIDNKRAIKFYEREGAVSKSKRRFFLELKDEH